MLRTSSYTIYVDLPANSEEMLLVQTYTGAFDRVSSRVATYVRSLEARRPAKPLYGDWSPEPVATPEVAQPTEATIDTLVRRGYLTTLSLEQEEQFFARYVEQLHALYSKRPPSYIFMPTYDCNLRCAYCFQDHMRTQDAFRHLLRRMTPGLVDRIISAMPQIEALHGQAPNAGNVGDVGFFGGEPLLAENLGIVEYIIAKLRKRGEMRFWAISNGTELDAYEHLLNPENLRSVQVTIDGPPREHDRRRIHADGSGSWDKISRNVTMALEQGVEIAIRTNVDRDNIEDLPELAEHILAQGWDRYPNFISEVSPIRASNENTDAKRTMNTWELDRLLTAKREVSPGMQVLGRIDDSLRRQAHRIFHGKGLPSFKSSFCSAHTGMYIFDPFGSIYACWEKTGDANVRIGHIDDEAAVHFSFDVQGLWRSRTVASNPVCLKCRYNLYCGGGCAVLALDHRSDFFANYCDGFAQRFRAAVADGYFDFISGKEPEEKSAELCDL